MQLLLFGCLVAIAFASCPSGTTYDSAYDKCYKYVEASSTFFKAELDCDSQGGHLASIQNAFENTIVTQLAPSGTRFWIGASLLVDPTTWSWSDNSSFTYTNWASSESDSTNLCATSNTVFGTWQPTACSQMLPYVCEIPPTPTPTPPKAACPVCSADTLSVWTYDNITGYCYLVSHGETWENAEFNCQHFQQGAHLATIHSAHENSLIYYLVSTYLKMDWDGMTWIGSYKPNGQTDTWINVDGTDFDYENWGKGMPDNPKTELCASLISDEPTAWGKDAEYTFCWNDMKCSTVMRAYVCKRRPIRYI